MRKKRVMKHQKSFWFLPITLVLLLAAAGIFYLQQRAAAPAKDLPASSTSIAQDSSLTLDEKVDKIVAGMTPAEKIGQMMMIGIKGTVPTGDSLYMLHEFHMGGIILFDRNMQNKEQVRLLNEALQKQADEKLPLFIALDEEGGVVSRMKDQLQPPPSAEQIGKSGNPEKAKTAALQISQELKAMGFNLDFAPVADTGSDIGRSYSTDPEVVIRFVNKAAEGYEEAQLLYCLKHFPGLGKGRTDSHQDSVTVDAAKAALETEDIFPFRKIIAAHNADDYFVMVSHISYPALDKNNPASLSPAVITDLLRKDCGYPGIIITDDMEMGALSNHYPFDELGVKAIQAGADMLLVCHEYEHETAVYNGVLKAVQNGTIPEERIDDSVRRIVRTKLLKLQTQTT